MWRLLDRIFFIILLFSFFVFGEDFEKLCDDEVLKEDFNVSLLQNYCTKTAQKYEDSNDVANASGYYLISNQHHKNLNYVEEIPKNSSGIYSNIGHSYMLTENFIKGTKYYKKFIQTYHNPNLAMQSDFQELLRLYPKYESQLKKAKIIWDKLYKPFIELDSLYNKLEYLEPSQESIQILKKIINIKENHIPYTLSITSDYQSLAIVYEDQFSEYDNALNYYVRMLNIFLASLGENYFNTATVYYNIANIYNTKGLYQESLELYNRALNIDLKIFGEEHSETAATYHNIATLYVNLGDFPRALKLYQKSLSIDLKILDDKEHEHITATYHEMANLLNYQGEYDRALALYFQILKIDLKKKNSKHIEIATLYHNIANTFKDKGEYHKSLDYYNKSLKITRTLLGEHHASTITTLHNIAYVHHYLGDYDKALKIYMKVLEYDFKIFGLNHPHTATTYHHIAYIYQDKKMYAEALEIYNMALDIRESILGEHHISTASTHHNIANILEDLKAYDEALLEYKKALKVEIDILGEEHPNTANSYHNIANVYQAKKEYSKSLNYYEKALNANLKNLRKNHPTIATNYHNMGISYFYNKDYLKAYTVTRQSFDIFLSNRIQNIKALDNSEKQNYLKHNKDIMRISHLFKTACFYNKQHNNKTTKSTFQYWLNYKGTLFEYQNILSMVKNNPKTTKEIKKIIQTLNTLNRQNSKEENQEVKKKIHNIEIKLSQYNDAFRELLKLKNIDHKQIASKLTPHQIYIDFMRGTDNYYIFTLDHKEQITFQQIETNETNSIDKYIYAYLDNTKNMAKYIENQTLQQHQETSKKEAKVILEKLSNVLVQNYLQRHIQEKKQLIISTDGLLNYFPFEALYHKGQYLIEKYTINYISSAKEFIRQIKLNPKNAKVTMTIFAHADFNAMLKSYNPKQVDTTLAGRFANQTKPTVPLIEQQHFSPLDDSEINIIKRYYPKAKIYRDKNASVQNLISMESSTMLHLSTHGLFLEDKNIINPMKKSVLVFAGANQARLQGNQEGIISALKLSTLNLQSTKLVVLSACQSGLGDIQNAEGIIGLPKALIQAGAKNVIMSLWTVSSHKTTTLMDYFYASLSEKQDYTTALQTAKIKMIKMHPYYWSAFVLSGI